MNFESIQPFSVAADFQPEWMNINKNLLMYFQPHFPGPIPALCIGGRTGRRLMGTIVDGVVAGTCTRRGSKWGVTSHAVNDTSTSVGNNYEYDLTGQPVIPGVITTYSFGITFRADIGTNLRRVFSLRLNSNHEYDLNHSPASGQVGWVSKILSPVSNTNLIANAFTADMGDWISVVMNVNGTIRYMWTFNHSNSIMRFSASDFAAINLTDDMEFLHVAKGGSGKSNNSFSGDILTFFLKRQVFNITEFRIWAENPIEWTKPFGHTALYPPVHCLVGEDKLYPGSSGDSGVRRTTMSSLGFGQSVSGEENLSLPASSGINGGASTSATVDICER